MRFGRRWLGHDGWWTLSTAYHVVANQFDVEFPQFHKLRPGKRNLVEDFTYLAGDIENTLPTIQSKITERDLINLEAGRFGAREMAIRRYGTAFASRVTIKT